jgi:hypothetical protein
MTAPATFSGESHGLLSPGRYLFLYISTSALLILNTFNGSEEGERFSKNIIGL